MNRLFVIGLLALSLGGCATFQTDLAKVGAAISYATSATVSPTAAQVTVSSFEVLEAGATAYFKYCHTSPADPKCAPGTKTSPGPLRLVIKYDYQGRGARDQIKLAGKTGALISVTAYNLLLDAVNNLAGSPASSFGAVK